MTKERLDYLDNLKILMTLLVIWHHIAIAFGGEGAFIITSTTQSSPLVNLGLTGFLAINQSYFMGLFFAVSSYFSYKALKKKGRGVFMKGKVKRLFIPALIYYFLVSPMNTVIIDLFQKGKGFNELVYYNGIGALWFVLALFMFDSIYALMAEKIHPYLTKRNFMIAFPLVIVVMWMVRIWMPVGSFIPVVAFQPAHFPQYIFAYLLGIAASKNHWLQGVAEKGLAKFFWGLIPIVGGLGLVIYHIITSVGNITYAFGGLNLYSALYCVFDMAMFIIMTFGLIGVFSKYFNKTNKTLAWFRNNAFGAYVMHYMAVTVVILLANQLPLGHMETLLIVAIAGPLLSFVFGRLTRPIFG